MHPCGVRDFRGAEPPAPRKGRGGSYFWLELQCLAHRVDPVSVDLARAAVGTCENQQVAVECGGRVETLVHQGPAPGGGVKLTCLPGSRDSRNPPRRPCENVYCCIIYKVKY